jgi:hypothetical protein
MSIAKRLHQLYQDKYLQPIYRRRLNDILSTLHQNTMKSKSQLRREAIMKSGTLREAETIVFGETTLEALEEKRRKEDQAAAIEKMH